MVERSHFTEVPFWSRLSALEQDMLYDLLRLPDSDLCDECLKRRESLCMKMWGIPHAREVVQPGCTANDVSDIPLNASVSQWQST